LNPVQNTIAAWTWNRKDWSEAQCLSFSKDGGIEFQTPQEYCPEVDENDDQFRDPQIVKVASKTYVMSIAKSHKYAVHFYGHEVVDNLPENQYPHFNKKIGKFSLKGYLGYQYECPNLVHLKNNDGEKYQDEKKSYWILFISINPGSQQGGSSTQYFIGEFIYPGTNINEWNENSEPFKLLYDYTTLIDVGKDFYAMQIVYIPPNATEISEGYDSAVGITWASNWQYTALVPTDPWRSSMAIPRRIKLGYYAPTGTPLVYIKSKMIFDEENKLFEDQLKKTTITESGQVIDIPNANGALEFKLSFKTCGDAFTNHNPGVISLYFIGGSVPEEYLIFGYNVKADAFFLDRGHTNVQWVHQNPFFTDKLSMNVYGEVNKTDKWDGLYQEYFTAKEGDKYVYIYGNDNQGECNPTKFWAHGIIDRNIIEVFFNEESDGYSFITSTNTFFFTGGNFIDKIKVEYNLINNKGFGNIEVEVRALNLKSNTESGRRMSEKKIDL
jgi:beta-fructofuranosidase